MKIDLQITSIYYVALKLDMVDNVLAWKREISDAKIIAKFFFFESNIFPTVLYVKNINIYNIFQRIKKYLFCI